MKFDGSGRSNLSATAFGDERVEHRHSERLEVPDIPGNHREAMSSGHRRDHRVLDQGSGLPVHQPSPFSERGRVQNQDGIGKDYLL